MSERAKKIAELTGKLDAMRLELRDLQELEFEEVTAPRMRENIGRHFKYKNCYSCPSEPSDYWWLYARIVGVRDGSYRMLCFQRDRYGKLEINELSTSVLSDTYQPISQSEFLAAVTPMLDELTTEVNHGTHG